MTFVLISIDCDFFDILTANCAHVVQGRHVADRALPSDFVMTRLDLAPAAGKSSAWSHVSTR